MADRPPTPAESYGTDVAIYGEVFDLREEDISLLESFMKLYEMHRRCCAGWGEMSAPFMDELMNKGPPMEPCHSLDVLKSEGTLQNHPLFNIAVKHAVDKGLVHIIKEDPAGSCLSNQQRVRDGHGWHGKCVGEGYKCHGG